MFFFVPTLYSIDVNFISNFCVTNCRNKLCSVDVLVSVNSNINVPSIVGGVAIWGKKVGLFPKEAIFFEVKNNAWGHFSEPFEILFIWFTVVASDVAMSVGDCGAGDGILLG